MKITRIETIPVRVPLKKGMSTKTAHGEHVVTEIVDIRVHTDEGLVGLGETTVAVRWTGETSQGAKTGTGDKTGTFYFVSTSPAARVPFPFLSGENNVPRSPDRFIEPPFRGLDRHLVYVYNWV